MYVRIVDYRDWDNNDGKEIGRVRMTNGTMQLEGPLSPTIQETLTEHEKVMAPRHLTDEEFLRSILLVFSGAYFKAGLIQEG